MSLCLSGQDLLALFPPANTLFHRQGRLSRAFWRSTVGAIFSVLQKLWPLFLPLPPPSPRPPPNTVDYSPHRDTTLSRPIRCHICHVLGTLINTSHSREHNSKISLLATHFTTQGRIDKWIACATGIRSITSPAHISVDWWMCWTTFVFSGYVLFFWVVFL